MGHATVSLFVALNRALNRQAVNSAATIFSDQQTVKAYIFTVLKARTGEKSSKWGNERARENERLSWGEKDAALGMGRTAKG